jgi:hypothetical protein
MALSHIQAKELIDQVIPVQSHSLLVRAIGWLETHYGSLTADPTANNWGNINAGNNEPFFLMKDGLGKNKEERRFAVYPTPQAGALAIYRLLSNSYPDAIKAAERGDWFGVARGMKFGKPWSPGSKVLRSYYEEELPKYAATLEGVARTITRATGEPGGPGGGGFGGALLGALLFFGVAYLGKRL